MARPYCCAHGVYFEVDRNGVDLVETRGAEKRPYKVFRADRYRCPVGDEAILANYGEPVVESYGPEFRDHVASVVSSMNADPRYRVDEVAGVAPDWWPS